jgi:glycosyltransferase involved in cell wall biosynthesis
MLTDEQNDLMSVAAKFKVLLIGPYPPPSGGLSIQIFELKKLLSERGISCHVLDVAAHKKSGNRKKPFLVVFVTFALILLRFCLKKYILHHLTSGHNRKSWLISILCALLGLLNNRKTILTFGSGLLPSYLKTINPIEKTCIRAALKMAGRIVVRNAQSLQVLTEFGVPSSKIVLLSGFLGISHIKMNGLPCALEAFIAKHSPIIGLHAGSGPEYGIKTVVEIFPSILRNYPNAGIVIFGVELDNLRGFDRNGLPLERIHNAGHLSHRHVISLMARLDLFLRATLFDGDANSIREALALNIPVVASNTDYRPEGTIRFEVGNREDMIKKIEYTLFNRKEIKDRLKKLSVPQSENFEQLLQLYSLL